MKTGPAADALVVFGISGDLARKKLFSALYDLTAAGKLDMPVIGVALSDWNDDILAGRAKEALDAEGEVVDSGVFARLASNLSYVSGDYRDPKTYDVLRRSLGGAACAVSYLAIPPSLFDDVSTGLGASGLAETGRVVVEKPFGRDTKSAIKLNQMIHRYYSEDRVFRIDHFLGKEAIQNLMIYRFANTVLEPVWNRHYVRGVQITMAEQFGVEGRGSFYDGVGAIRDVVQNHLLQVVALLAMEPPVSDHPDALRDERVKVLRAMRPFSPNNVVLGQYSGFLDEDGVEAHSTTETFAAMRFEIDSWRWAGVPWIIRTGKGMSTTVTEAVVEFRRPPRPLFADADCDPGPNRISFRSKPQDRITLAMQAKEAGQGMVSGPVDFVVDHGANSTSAKDPYDKLIGNALDGDASLFARQDGVLEAWRIVDPILTGPQKVHSYERGSWGPSEADRLLADKWEWITNLATL